MRVIHEELWSAINREDWPEILRIFPTNTRMLSRMIGPSREEFDEWLEVLRGAQDGVKSQQVRAIQVIALALAIHESGGLYGIWWGSK